MIRKTSVMFLVLLAVTISGCVERTSYITKERSDKVAEHILKQPPATIQHAISADLDGKIKLLGYDLEKPEEVVPGDQIEVTWYWKCEKSPGGGWRLFTHMLDARGRSRVNQDKKGDVRVYFQPEHWREGMVIRDVQPIVIPSDWNSEAIELRVGIWRDNERMPVKGNSSDGSNRIRGPRIQIGKLTVKAVQVVQAKVAPEIDGEFDNEAAWKDTLKLGEFVHTMSGEPVPFSTDVRLSWDSKNFYVAMNAADDNLESRYTKHDDELWHEDAFEIFLDPGGDKKDYYEFQVSPAGVVFDSHLPEYRKNRNEWSSKMVVAVTRKGSLNDDADIDKGWTAELAIPFASLEQGEGVPPKAGDRWRANFFRVNITKDKTSYSAWSPPLRGDFHALDRFGELVFEGNANMKEKDDKDKQEPKGPKGTNESEKGGAK